MYLSFIIFLLKPFKEVGKMNFYICSTPYHLFISLCHIQISNVEAILYLSTHDSKSEKIFKQIEERLKKLPLIRSVVIRKRSRLKEKLKIEKLKDYLEYTKFKSYLNSGCVYIFPWNPYSLYTISNFLYMKAKKVVLIEDGANLYSYPKPNKFKLLAKKYLYGVSINFFEDEKLEKILVQFPEKYPSHLKHKIERLNIEELFGRLSKKEKEMIISVFLTEEEVNVLKKLTNNNSVIVLTQPLSEDKFTSEQQKIKLYKEIITKYQGNYQVIIKKHPRERTTYNFENVLELEGDFPSEIFTMLGIRFKKAIGICTSATKLISADERINTDENFFKRRREK